VGVDAATEGLTGGEADRTVAPFNAPRAHQSNASERVRLRLVVCRLYLPQMLNLRDYAETDGDIHSLIEQQLVSARRQRAAAWPRFLLSFVLMILVFPVGLWLYLGTWRDMSHGPFAVLWIRRFTRPWTEAYRTKWSLMRALRGHATLLTIADSRIDADWGSALGRRGWLAFVPSLMAKFLLLASLLGGIGVALWLGVTGDRASGALLVLACSAGIGSWFLVMRWLRRRFGRADLRTASDIRDAIASARAFHGPTVLRCSDENWRDAVTTMLREVDAAVIDCAEATTNTEWEVATATQVLGPAKLLFVPHQDGTAGAQPGVLGKSDLGRLGGFLPASMKDTRALEKQLVHAILCERPTSPANRS
jgi:hypothetical protein